MTAATGNYLIEQVGPVLRWDKGRRHVNLCKRQGDRWVTIRRNITRQIAASFGFNLDSPAVQRVFDGVHS